MKIKALILNCLILIFCLFFTGCNEEVVHVDVNYKSDIYINETTVLTISSTKSNDTYEITNLTPDIININGNIITGLTEGIASIKITNSTGIVKYFDISVNDLPIPESINIVFEEDNVVMNKVYTFDIKTIPENAKVDLRLSYNSNNIDINLETKEIIFKDTGIQKVSFYSKDNIKIKDVLTVDVGLNPEIEYYELLFIGNSLTKYTVYDVPSMVEEMIKADNVDVKITVDDIAPQFIIDHKSSFDALITKRKYTHVILQEKSNGSYTEYQKFEDAVLLFNEKIKENGAKTVLYQTWAYNGNYNGLTKYEMYKAIKEAYTQVGNKIGAIITKAGDAFIKYEELYPNGVSLYTDINHASIYGGYLSACVHYATITGRKSSKNGYVYPEIDTKTALELKAIADMIVFE